MSALPGAAIIAQAPFGEALIGPAGIPIAFVVGVISFLTPCVLPLVPGYLAYVSGLAGSDLAAGERRSRAVAGSALFVMGFAIVFTALGASASALGGFLLERLGLLNRIAGAFVILLGLIFISTVWVRVFARWRERSGGVRSAIGTAGLKVSGIFAQERHLSVRPRAGLAGALPLGSAFAIGWVPCVGPGLGVILTLAAAEGSVGRGAAMLFSFSLGFGVWFILAAAAFSKATRAFAAVRRHMLAFTAVGGVFLVGVGVLLATEQWARFVAPLQRWFIGFA